MEKICMDQKNYSVLVVDDEVWVCENLRGMLDWREHGFVFLEPALNGQDAIERIGKEKPDIVISDINMPLMSGTELIEKCAEKYPSTVFIALSGYSDYNFVRSSLVGGAVDYILKPIGKTQLLAVLGKAISQLADRTAQAKNKRDAIEMRRQTSMRALDREYSAYLKSATENTGRGYEVLTGRLAEYELEFSGFALILFYVPRLFGKTSAGAFNAEQAAGFIRDGIGREVTAANHFVFHNIN
ncbi:MAG: response regulator, partial [Clostridiales bacterium]|nr:response regulator [Clostridiales bacterium]